MQLFGWYEDEIYVYIVMEYMEHGDLDKHIDFRWKEDDIKVVAVQVLEGLKIMHDDGIIHRDLKPAVSIDVAHPLYYLGEISS